MPASSFRFFLREQTRPAHERLDRLVGPIDSAARYGAFLRASYAHRAAVEGYLAEAAWPAPFGAWRPAALLPLLRQDLADLGLPRPEVRPLDLSKDISRRIGVAYVQEGSSLGARLIVKMAAGLGFDGARGARHLAAQAGGLSNWQSFVGIIDGLSGVDQGAAVGAAVAAFDHAAAAMKGNGFS
ncbi:biliverdin-producing heme oxygenase [Bosea sp. R86505]|uniref:biliverdin-producing heme oxygenase n=1 Tax=Bosea sp. R86505 TaxID=3101710 RepID=UPI00366DC615